MRKRLLAIMFLGLCSMLSAQQTLNNESVIKMVKAGLSDDVIATTINASAGSYDASPDGLIALKTAGAGEKVVSAIVKKSNPSTPAAATEAEPIEAARTGNVPQKGDKPRIFLTSVSKGSQWNAARNQSMEMSKDFEKDCPGVRITINRQTADYIVKLNHLEHGFSRDNQIQIANSEGDLISNTQEGGSIRSNIKKACEVIVADWSKK